VDEILFDCDGTMITDRKAAGERLLGYAARMRQGRTEARWTLGTFNGIGLELSGYEALDTDGRRYLCTVIAMHHHGEHADFEVTEKTRPSTAIGRIESSIRDLDTDLAAVRASLEANERRLPAFEARLGQAFPDAASLDEKLNELADLEAELASTKGEFDAGNDDDAPLPLPLDGAGTPVPQEAAVAA
jgi:hypothetical protein